MLAKLGRSRLAALASKQREWSTEKISTKLRDLPRRTLNAFLSGIELGLFYLVFAVDFVRSRISD